MTMTCEEKMERTEYLRQLAWAVNDLKTARNVVKGKSRYYGDYLKGMVRKVEAEIADETARIVKEAAQ